MPEIGEIARLVHYLKKNLVGKTLSSVQVQEDTIVYGKCGITAAQFQAAMTGKKVVGAGQQGKYFWLTMSTPPHALLHCSMTGWIKYSHDDASFYKPQKKEDEGWPPKYWKFILETDEKPARQAAFVDPRRLGRIRLIDCAADVIRHTPPLDQNGPDPVLDKDILTNAWFAEKARSKRVPVKAFLLDQAIISGVGNWVGDEILFHAKIHPEQYTSTLNEAQLDQLHESLLHICDVAVETLADQEQFPENWLMKHRWGKGKKEKKLPTGETVKFVTVGGRTSAFVPSVQQKTGPVAADADGDGNGVSDNNEEQSESVDAKSRADPPRKRTAASMSNQAEAEDVKAGSGKGRSKRSKPEEKVVPKASVSMIQEENEDADEEVGTEKMRAKTSGKQGKSKKGTVKARGKGKGKETAIDGSKAADAGDGRRRSARVTARASSTK
ncbi:MAG: hypothetical protein M1826_006971 [Phylliscum demangeonii]|nr:MAG: hypothetical protein M1826_006971 [Phylliscum demangeonii]